MRPLTLEWVEKAEGDFATSQREMRARKFPNYDAACFHAQQTAEKYLKAFLQENGMMVPRTHHLIELLSLCVTKDAEFHTLRSDLLLLDRYAVRFRYPGETANKEEAKMACQSARVVRRFVRIRLGLNE